jgi:hypothetical protein
MPEQVTNCPNKGKPDQTEKATRRMLELKEMKVRGHLTVCFDGSGVIPNWEEVIKH